MVETKLGLLEFKKGNLTAKFSSINHKNDLKILKSSQFKTQLLKHFHKLY